MIQENHQVTHSIQIIRPPAAILKQEGLDLKILGFQQQAVIKKLFESYLSIFANPEFAVFQHPRQMAQLQNPDHFFVMDFAQPDVISKSTSKLTPTPTSHQLKLIISIAYCTAQDMQNHNHQYRGKDYATNILTFPSFIKYADHIEQQIDLLLCPAVIAQEAKAQNKSLFSHYAHLYLHGLLHGFGFDHELEDQALEMEAIEVAILNKLGFTSPY